MFVNLLKARILRTLLLLTFWGVLSLTAFDHESRARAFTKPQSAAQVSDKWERYTLQDSQFSVSLPTVPAMSTSPTPHSDKTWKSHRRNLIGAYSQGVVYVIKVFQVRQSLDDFVTESRESSGMDFKREISVSGVRGMEYTSRSDEGNGIRQFFIRDQQIFMFLAWGSRLGNADVGIPMFFESIKFDRGPGDLVISDGPGVQNSTDPALQPDKIHTGKEVTVKARVLSKPEPNYTEDARQNGITGTVVLRAVFTSYGAVTNISARSELPHGLTGKAIAAARQIRFIPPIKDGRFVSMYIQLEYNFNLY